MTMKKETEKAEFKYCWRKRTRVQERDRKVSLSFAASDPRARGLPASRVEGSINQANANGDR